MTRVRPLSQLDDVIGQLGVAAGRAAGDVVQPMTFAVRGEVERYGRRFALRGANSNRVVLSASSRVQGNGQRRVGFVRGNPPGFWRIVEEGSSRHLIAGRYRRQGGAGPRLRQGTVASRRRAFIRDLELSGNSPIRLGGIGYRQWAIHPGHRSIGRPWRQAMDRAPDVAARVMFTEAGRQLGRVWKG